MSSVLIAQLCDPPTVMALWAPAGGSASPSSLSPQQVMVSSVLIAQLWNRPAVTAL